MRKNSFLSSSALRLQVLKVLKSCFAISLIAATLVSCDLEPEIYDRIAPNNFYQTVNDLKAATTSVYWELKTNGWSPYLCSDGSSFIMNEVATEEWTTKWSWEAFLNLDWIIGEKMVYGFYPRIMTAITRATYVIEKIKDSPLSDDIKDPYIAEIRCLRAYWAFDLYRFYGCLPITVDRDIALYPASDYRPSRPSKEWMLNFIESELRASAGDLPKTQTEYGRCTKGMALTKLLKFYMHEKEWTKAEGVTQEIMTLGYGLMDNYADIFKVENEQNKEIIFAVTCEPRDGFGLLWFSNTLPPDFKSAVGVNYVAWSGWRVPWAFYDSFENGDKRKDLIWATYTNKSGNTVNLRSIDIGALPLKYAEDPSNPGQWAGNDFIHLRYADVLLCRAEILNELNGPTQESVDLINQVRERAFDNYYTSGHVKQLSDFAGQTVLRDYILKERSWELWCEGVRREDLLRHGTYLDVARSVGANRVSEKNLLFPIPTDKLIENPNIGQNPFYNE